MNWVASSQPCSWELPHFQILITWSTRDGEPPDPPRQCSPPQIQNPRWNPAHDLPMQFLVRTWAEPGSETNNSSMQVCTECCIKKWTNTFIGSLWCNVTCFNVKMQRRMKTFLSCPWLHGREWCEPYHIPSLPHSEPFQDCLHVIWSPSARGSMTGWLH